MKHIVAALVAVIGVAPARADDLTATRGEPLLEVSHTVDIRIADGVAIYKVRRQFANPGKVADEASLAIDLPAGAAATGLRIRARDRWYDGELMERGRAEALYHELTGLGAWRPKDPALLQWQWADKLHLQVFPVLPGQVSTVEYTLTVPTRYASGRYWVSYPRVVAGGNTSSDARRLATPAVTVHPTWGDATTRITVDGVLVASDTPVVLVPPPHQAWQDAVQVEPAASYVASTLAVPASSHTTKPLAALVLTLDVSHTYKSDLRIELVTPQGKVVRVHDGTGGGDNDVRGAFRLALPPGTTGAGTWHLVASDRAALDTGAIDGWSLAFGAGADATTAKASDTPVFIPDAPETANDAGVAPIAIAPPPIDRWTARFGRVVASDAHAFARLEIDVAPQLSALPKRAQVVFIVDASYSVGRAHLAAQLAVIRAYLSHVPDAEVELVATRRRATRVFGRFVPVDTALAALRPETFALGNGSALDDAAQLATAALADRVGPRRVVITSDELFRTALTPELAARGFAQLSPATVVHVVVPRLDFDDRVSLAPSDNAPFTAIAARHHGVHFELGGVLGPSAPTAAIAKALAPVALELVRPTRIDHLVVTGMTTDATELHEGDGLRLFAGVARAPDQLTIAGRLWSDPIRRQLAPGAVFSRQTAAFVFGADEHGELSPEEMMTVALLGRAVSPVTSYVAAEPGTRPSTLGLALEERGGIGSGHGGMTGGAISGASEPLDLRALIDSRPCERQVKPPPGWRVTLAVETTRDEVVDVRAAKDAMAACLVETVWQLHLPDRFASVDRASFEFQLGAP